MSRIFWFESLFFFFECARLADVVFQFIAPPWFSHFPKILDWLVMNHLHYAILINFGYFTPVIFRLTSIFAIGLNVARACDEKNTCQWNSSALVVFNNIRDSTSAYVKIASRDWRCVGRSWWAFDGTFEQCGLQVRIPGCAYCGICVRRLPLCVRLIPGACVYHLIIPSGFLLMNRTYFVGFNRTLRGKKWSEINTF